MSDVFISPREKMLLRKFSDKKWKFQWKTSGFLFGGKMKERIRPPGHNRLYPIPGCPRRNGRKTFVNLLFSHSKYLLFSCSYQALLKTVKHKENIKDKTILWCKISQLKDVTSLPPIKMWLKAVWFVRNQKNCGSKRPSVLITRLRRM